MKKQTTVDNAISMFLGTFINIIISVVTTPIITRIVIPSDYGQWSLFTSYSNIMMAVVMLGLDQALVRFYYKYDSIEYQRYIVHSVIKIPLAICLVIGTFGFPIFKHINLFEYNSWDIYLLLILNIIVLVVNRIGLLVLRMEQKGKQYSILIVTNKLFYILILVFFLFATDIKDFLALSFSTFMAQLIVTVISIVIEREKWSIKVATKYEDITVKRLLIYALPFVYAMLAGDIFNFADKWIVKSIKGFDHVGIYSAAANIVAITSIIQSTFSLLWAPMAMKQYERDPEDKSFYVKANGCITLAMFMLGAGIICFKDIIVLILGSKYRGAATVVPFLLFNPIMTNVSETTVYGLNFKNKTWYHMIITTVSAVTNIILNLILVPMYSSEGAALATAISYTLFFVLRTYFSNKCYRINFPLVKFFTVTGAFFVYSTLNTFFQLTFGLNLILFIVFIALLFVLYGKYFKMLISILVTEFMKRFKRSSRES